MSIELSGEPAGHAPAPRSPAPSALGPSLVALGAAGWGAENLPRARLDRLNLPAYPIVFVEHILQVLFTLPWLLRHARLIPRIPRRALVYVFLSGSVGSALGTVCYTAALATVNPTAAAMLLNLQPIVSTAAGALLFKERIPARFYPYAALAVGAGVAIAIPSGAEWAAFHWQWQGGLALVFGTVLCWGFATAAGRGAMREMPLGLGAPLRLWSGLWTMGIVLAIRALAGQNDFVLSQFLGREAIHWMLILTTLCGVGPLFVYFAGLARTPASIAGYCEMFYTLSATYLGWRFLGGTLLPHQSIAAAVLVFAVIQLNRVQRHA